MFFRELNVVYCENDTKLQSKITLFSLLLVLHQHIQLGFQKSALLKAFPRHQNWKRKGRKSTTNWHYFWETYISILHSNTTSGIKFKRDLKVCDDGILIQLLCFWTLSISCFYLKHMFRRLDSVSVFRWNLLGWAQSIDLVYISEHQHQHKLGYIKQSQHKPSARVKSNIKNIKKNCTHEA
jgi:hypothetical protein